MLCIRNDLFRIRIQIQLRIFRLPPILFSHIWKLFQKITLNSIKKKNIPIICHFLFQSTVLQYTQTRIHRPKMVNKISNLFALSFSAGSGTIIPDPDQGKVPDPDTKHCMVFYICYWLFLINFLIVYIHRQRRPVTTGSVVHPFTVINNN